MVAGLRGWLVLHGVREAATPAPGGRQVRRGAGRASEHLGKRRKAVVCSSKCLGFLDRNAISNALRSENANILKYWGTRATTENTIDYTKNLITDSMM